MNTQRSIERTGMDAVDGARIAVGFVWLAGAAFNTIVTLRLAEPYDWLVEESRLRVCRWFFRDVASSHPTAWTLALIASETTLGFLTLARGSSAKLGLAGGTLFSFALFALSTPYTMMMGPYGLILAWLMSHDFPQSISDRLSSVISHHRERRIAR